MDRLKNAPFILIGVNSDSSPERVAKAIERENITWPSFYDGGSARGPIAVKWKVSRWPTIYVIDHHGMIRFMDVRGEDLDHAVDTLLEELRRDSFR